MAHPFGDQDQSPGGAAKRPAHTIEGTATEVKVEPEPGETARAEPEAKTQKSEAPSAGEAAPSQRPHRLRRQRPGRGEKLLHALRRGAARRPDRRCRSCLAWSGLDSAKGRSAPDIAALEQRLPSSRPRLPPRSMPRRCRRSRHSLPASKTNVKEMSPKLAGLADRVAQLETSLKTLAETASEGGSVATAAAIAQQIAEAEQRLDAKIAASLAEGKGASAAALEQMQTEIAELKAKLGALAEAELGTGESPDLAALTERIAKLEATLPEIVNALNKEIGRRQVRRGRHRLRQSPSRGQRRSALRRRARHHRRARPVGRRSWRAAGLCRDRHPDRAGAGPLLRHRTGRCACGGRRRQRAGRWSII